MIDFILKFFKVHRCAHERIRCLHGDEIIIGGYKRSACIDCSTVFDSLPEFCYYTKEPHNPE